MILASQALTVALLAANSVYIAVIAGGYGAAWRHARGQARLRPAHVVTVAAATLIACATLALTNVRFPLRPVATPATLTALAAYLAAFVLIERDQRNRRRKVSPAPPTSTPPCPSPRPRPGPRRDG